MDTGEDQEQTSVPTEEDYKNVTASDPTGEEGAIEPD